MLYNKIIMNFKYVIINIDKIYFYHIYYVLKIYLIILKVNNKMMCNKMMCNNNNNKIIDINKYIIFFYN